MNYRYENSYIRRTPSSYVFVDLIFAVGWKWKSDGSGSGIEVEVGWKWKLDGSGSTREVVVDGPNEPPLYDLY